MYKRRKGKSIVKKSKNAKLTYKGTRYRSALEVYMAQCLDQAGIKSDYEKHIYTLMPGFKFKNSSYERQANSKGLFQERGNSKVQPITYKPDFVGEGFIIEVKGYANEAFRNRWKLFKRLVSEELPEVTLFKPQTKKECDKVIEIIKQREIGRTKKK